MVTEDSGTDGEQEKDLCMDSFIAFLILPGLNFCGLGGISFRERRERLMASEKPVL
jgi:hypothetical protein